MSGWLALQNSCNNCSGPKCCHSGEDQSNRRQVGFGRYHHGNGDSPHAWRWRRNAANVPMQLAAMVYKSQQAIGHVIQ
jgi:hypothetical protein